MGKTMEIGDVVRDKCPLCGGPASTALDSALVSHGVVTCPIATNCERCGKFSITFEALTEVERRKVSVAISGIAREWTELERSLEISKDNLGSLINLAPKTLRQRKLKLLQAIVRKCPNFEVEHVFHTDRDFPIAYVQFPKEFIFMLRCLQSEKLADWRTNQNTKIGIVLTAKGWEEVDAIEKPAALREKAFVAMWFDDQVNSAFHEGIAPAIKETGYHAIRIDLPEHSESIIDRIFAEIKEAGFVVADFTGQRGGVYFEAGFARGLGLNVIWTCRDDHFKDRHFDVHGFNMIVWKTHDELRERLKLRIRAVVGYGPLYDPR
jgi:nucleoside 2-deoxyribosyltransferase